MAYRETSHRVRAKAEAAMAAGLIPVVCVGEPEDDRLLGRAEEVVAEQMTESLPEGFGTAGGVVAYEPVWAIGTGRTPTEAEMENCRPFFEAQLEVLQPDYIICWGVVAMKAVLGTNEPIGRVRGRFYRYHQAKVLVTYHPSYLLRTPEAKKETWLDMQMLMRDLGIPIPSSGATTGNGSAGNRPNKGSS
jgi:hypothetical protein